MARGAREPYDPDPRGVLSAREALAAEMNCSPEDLLLTASTSEAYSFLFKLLTDPGDEVLIPVPSYPLLEHLAAMERVTLRPFPLELHRRWELHVEPPSPLARAVVVVNPNNPTGSYVTRDEQDSIARLGLPVVSDEVFLDYPLEGTGSSFVRDDVLTFTLGGLSKSAGLPHFKLGWIRVSGPAKAEALDALELIADNFLSVATPVQTALPELLKIAPRIRAAISARTRAHLGTLRGALKDLRAVSVLPVEAGWSAVIRVPRLMSDEELALALLDRGVLVQPGYFFDFANEGFLVVSLLTPEETFAEGVRRIAEMMG
jgi:alanine-synthesizing transaminase